MRLGDRQVGWPMCQYRDTQANLEALALTPDDGGSLAFATDLGKLGLWTGSAWLWFTLDHGNMDGLGDDDHPLYLLTSGARAGATSQPQVFERGVEANGTIRADLFSGKYGPQIPDALMICHFDGPHPFETDFTGDAHGHMGQVPTISGSVIFRPGKFGKAVQVAESTTNLTPDPVCAGGDTWLFIAGAGGGAITRYADNNCIAGYRKRSQFGGCTTWTQFFRDNLSSAINPNSTYTVSFRARSDQPRQVSWMVQRGSSPFTTYLVFGPFDLSTEWQEFTATVESPSAITDGWAWMMFDISPPDGWIDLDWVQLEEKPYRTPLCYGGMGNGHSWSGAEHNSESDRIGPTEIRWEVETALSPTEGTVMFWFKRSAEAPNADFPDWSRLFSFGYWSSSPTQHQFIAAYYDQDQDTLYFLYHNPDNDGRYGVGITPPLDTEWHHYAFTYKDGEPLRVYIDGSLSGESLTSIVAFTTLDTALPFGIRETPGTNGWYDEFVTIARALSADEIRAIYESNAPVFASTSTWHLAGPLYQRIVNISSDYTVQPYDGLIVIDASSADITITLPDANTCIGRAIWFVRTDYGTASGTTVTLQAATGDTINGFSSRIIDTQYAPYIAWAISENAWVCGLATPF